MSHKQGVWCCMWGASAVASLCSCGALACLLNAPCFAGSLEASDIRRIGGGSSSGLSELGRYRTRVSFHLLVPYGPGSPIRLQEPVRLSQ
jgi:hypothetical protein